MKGFRAAIPALAALLLSGTASFVSAQQTFVLAETYPRSQAANVVFLAEGYTESQFGAFRTDAASFRDAFLADPSLAAYANYFNFYGIFSVSADSGATADNIDNDAHCIDGTPRAQRNTAWGASFCGTGYKRLLFVADENEVESYVRQRVPEADLIVVVVNTDSYGGAGNGVVAVADRAHPNIIVHESGHAFAGLADEYDDDVPGYNTRISANITSNNTLETVHWNHWIEDSTPVPTPDVDAWRNVVGVFEGAGYRSTGWYRPKHTCRMRSNNADFCEVCAETWVLKLYRKASPLVSASPESGTAVSAKPGEAVRLAVETRIPSEASRTVRVQWEVDGRVLSGVSGREFSRVLDAGSHVVRALVQDTTPLVRKDAEGLLRDEASWTVLVGADGISDGGPADGRPANLAAELAVGEVTRRGARLAIPRSGLHRVELFGADGRRIGDLGWHDFPAGAHFLQWPGSGLPSGNVLVRVTRASDRASVEKRVAVE